MTLHFDDVSVVAVRDITFLEILRGMLVAPRRLPGKALPLPVPL